MWAVRRRRGSCEGWECAAPSVGSPRHARHLRGYRGHTYRPFLRCSSVVDRLGLLDRGLGGEVSQVRSEVTQHLHGDTLALDQ